jgi:hypothetical protein
VCMLEALENIEKEKKETIGEEAGEKTMQRPRRGAGPTGTATATQAAGSGSGTKKEKRKRGPN